MLSDMKQLVKHMAQSKFTSAIWFHFQQPNSKVQALQGFMAYAASSTVQEAAGGLLG